MKITNNVQELYKINSGVNVQEQIKRQSKKTPNKVHLGNIALSWKLKLKIKLQKMWSVCPKLFLSLFTKV